MAKLTNKRPGIARTETVTKIFNLFIKPLLNEFILAPNATDNVLHRKLEMWFDKDNRDVWEVRARTPFAITGPRWATPDTPEKSFIDGEGDRAVAKGDRFHVRTDAKRPDVVELEFKGHVYLTRATDWSVLSEKVDFIR